MSEREDEIWVKHLKEGIFCQLEGEGYIDKEQLEWLVNEINKE